MFGLEKKLNGIADNFLDKIGLGFLSPFVSGSFFGGNYEILADDVIDIVEKFSSSAFLKNLNQLNPLGNFGKGKNNFDNTLPGNRLDILKTTAQESKLTKANQMLAVVDEFRASFNLIQKNRKNAHYGFLR